MISNTSGLNKHLAYRLLLSTALAGFPLFAATAQNAADSPVRLAQAAQTYRFSIPAQPLPSAINAFSAVTGWEIGYPAGLGQGAGSPGVSGSLGAEEALRQLLSGTGLGYRLTGAGTVTLVPASDATVLQPITVQGQAVTVPPTAVIGNPPPVYAGGQVARGGQLGLLGNADIMDTPFNTTSYTSKTVQDQQARTIADVLDNDPSVRAVSSRGTYDSNFMIRGFSVNNDDIAYGGLYGILPRMITSAELAERIEVLKGPSTLLNGIDPSGSVGGTINLVPKRAGDEPLTQVTLNYMSDAQFGVATDIARRAGERNQYGLRFNGSYRSGDVPPTTRNRISALPCSASTCAASRCACHSISATSGRTCSARCPTSLRAAPSPVPLTPATVSSLPGLLPKPTTPSAPCAARWTSPTASPPMPPSVPAGQTTPP